jgi:hypothetical protein
MGQAASANAISRCAESLSAGYRRCTPFGVSRERKVPAAAFARGEQRRLLAGQRGFPGGRLLFLCLSRTGGVPRPTGGAGAYFDETLGEFVLPYDTVRAAEKPDALLLKFLSTSYAAAAEAGGWDRVALECPIGVPGQLRRL